MVRATCPRCVFAALATALLAIAALTGCALFPGRRNDEVHYSSPPAVAVAPVEAQPSPAPHPPQPTPPVLTASHAEASYMQPAQPEPVPAPPPASQLPLSFAAGTTLVELERLAEEHHPRLAAAMQEIEAAHGRTWQAGRMPNPSLGASSPQLAGSESQYNVFVTQEIPSGGKLRLNRAAAAEEIDQAELSLSRARYDVLTSVRKHFYAALIAQARVAVLQEQVEMIRRSVQTVRMRFEGGEGNKTDVMLLEVDLQKAEVALAGAETDLTAQQRQLAAAAGIPELPLNAIAGNLEIELAFGDLDSLAQRVVASHAQPAIAAIETRRQQVLVDRAYAEPKPTYHVQGGYQRQVGPPQDQGILQLTMSVPLWDRNWGGIQAAEAHAAKAQADLSRIETELSSQAAAARGRYLAAQQLVAKYQGEILAKTREALELARRLYGEGETDFQSLLHAQEARADAQLKYLDAQAARWEAAIEIADLLQLEQFP